MQILLNRPNVLFLIAVRKPTLYHNLLCIKKLLRNVYLHKVVKAYSTYFRSIKPMEDNDYIEIVERWFLNGMSHRNNEPAYIRSVYYLKSDPPNKITMVEKFWQHHGKLLNDNGPCSIYNSPSYILHLWSRIKDDGSSGFYHVIYNSNNNEYIEGRIRSNIINVEYTDWD